MIERIDNYNVCVVIICIFTTIPKDIEIELQIYFNVKSGQKIGVLSIGQ